MFETCFCRCHVESRFTSFIPADVEDALAAAIACDLCRDKHCPALLSQRLANEAEPVPREKGAWVDHIDNGEGAEA
jgi:hypothetical protein